MIDLTMHGDQMRQSAAYCRERGILLPTFAQMKDPSRIPESIVAELTDIGLWDIHPRNLFRITWKNEQVETGGGYGGVNYLELPSSLTGVPARIFALVGRWFPTGAHKVGATYGCLAPRLVTGQFSPQKHRAVWPSTGNYCRGGAYVSSLLACDSIAILPEGMSRERFDWLKTVAGEVIATPGSESNVKEIFDKCWELRETRQDIVIFNQFEEFGNHLWHFEVTGNAMLEVLRSVMSGNDRFAGVSFSSGSAGTLASGDFLKTNFPDSRIAVSEALQCPTLLENGFGSHRIEGIGDKHVPWIHNVRNTDLIVAVDDEITIRLMRLFNEPAGREYLVTCGVSEPLVSQLDLLGISGIGNVVTAIKMAKYYELTENDLLFTVFTDSMQLYSSRLSELRDQRGPYRTEDAIRDYEALRHVATDSMEELRYPDRRRVHNLKYYTWIEQQGRELDELNAQWYDFYRYWNRDGLADAIDEHIVAFNDEIGATQ